MASFAIAPGNPCLILIGMPGAGKSTLGVLLAKRRTMQFVDTDLLLQENFGMPLQDFLDLNGIDQFLRREAEVLLALGCSNTVLATGGSAIYNEAAMAHLALLGPCIYLSASVETLRGRLGNAAARGIAGNGTLDLEALYRERTPRYRRFADMEIATDGRTHQEALEALSLKLDEHGL